MTVGWWYLGEPVQQIPSMQPKQRGRELPGVEIPSDVAIVRCKACPALIWWGLTAAGKRNPFDVVDGQPTAVTHFSTCPNVRRFERGRKS